MTPEEAEEYTQSLGQIFSGSWRQVAWAIQQGVPKALGIPVEEWGRRLEARVKIGIEERKAAARELANEGMSQREIGAALGVSKDTIGRDLSPVSDETDHEDEQEFWAPPVSDETPESKPSTRELLGQSDQNDWRTPRKFLLAAHAVLGAVDLDPASSAEANETVQAALFYTEDDDGLSQPWKGRVWLNPPYGGSARLFVERLIREYEVGNVTAAITLVNSHPTETVWFQQLFRHTLCFVRGRIDFGGPSREVSTNSTHGSALAYLGPDTEAFAARFGEFGAVVRRV